MVTRFDKCIGAVLLVGYLWLAWGFALVGAYLYGMGMM